MSKEIFGKINAKKANENYDEEDQKTSIDYSAKFNTNYKAQPKKPEPKDDDETVLAYGSNFNSKYGEPKDKVLKVDKKISSVNEEDEEEESKESSEIATFLSALKIDVIPHSKLIYKASDRLPTKPRKVFKGLLGGLTVIIKEFDVEYKEERELELFKKELAILKTLGPTITVKLLGCTTSQHPLVYIVTEYFENIALDSQIAKGSWGLDEKTKISEIKKISAIYKTLEEKKIVHLQLNPFHILINSSQDARICGFTKAQIMGAASEKYNGVVSRLLWRYTAPEVLKDNTVSSKADSYSFGIFFVEFFSGQGFLHDKDDFKISTITNSIEENKSLLDLGEFKVIEGKLPDKIFRFAKQLLNVNPTKRLLPSGLSRVLDNL